MKQDNRARLGQTGARAISGSLQPWKAAGVGQRTAVDLLTQQTYTNKALTKLRERTKAIHKEVAGSKEYGWMYSSTSASVEA
jgi:hypothetical protein